MCAARSRAALAVEKKCLSRNTGDRGLTLVTFLHIFPSHHRVQSPETDKRTKYVKEPDRSVSALVFVIKQLSLPVRVNLSNLCVVSCVNLAFVLPQSADS